MDITNTHDNFTELYDKATYKLNTNEAWAFEKSFYETSMQELVDLLKDYAAAVEGTTSDLNAGAMYDKIIANIKYYVGTRYGILLK